ncbi:MAG TPA: radical SAM protein [Gammaproteobacteria bacterium]|nr:radical SAM protein [Gammaproteobacteria bacterium]
MPPEPAPKVLVITGGLLTEKDTSLWQALKKQILQSRYTSGDWLENKIKLLAAEPVIAAKLEQRIGSAFAHLPHDLKKRIFDTPHFSDIPELTEVALITGLAQEGMEYETTTIHHLFADSASANRLLARCECVFVSSTLLRDVSELRPLLKHIKRSHNRIVVGGALVGLIHHNWPDIEEVDMLAIGYGEMLIPSLAAWINSGYKTLVPPHRGRVTKRGNTLLLFSGVPQNRTLDFLPRPEWERIKLAGNRTPELIYYESVRGCPYRCGFCNYPYLFDDTHFRYKSAEKMVDEWAYYANELGVKYISCLDALFTIPKQRLLRFCQLLMERNVDIKWICYARADDLTDEKTLQLMKQAGLHQVQIGIESGNQNQLDNMNKACSVEANALALKNCRKHNVTTIVSLIVGYPGETRQSLDETYHFLKTSPPDFYYLAAFSTRAENVPVLKKKSRQKFGLHVAQKSYTTAPYWYHASMDCIEASNHIRNLNHRLMKERISLNAVLFYQGLMNFRNEDREALLNLQQNIAHKHPVNRAIFSLLHRIFDKKLSADMNIRLKHSSHEN